MMKHAAALLLMLVLVPLSQSAAADAVELPVTTFRFLRTESRTFPSTVKDQRSVTVLYGVFAFRHSQPQPLKVWGFDPPAKDGKFTARFPNYQVQVNGSWQKVPVGYCGTGAVSYDLAPETDYLLLIPVNWPEFASATSIRVSATAESGEAWSEPFRLSKAGNNN